MSHTCSPFTPIIMKLHTQTLHETRMCPIDLGSKGQGHNAMISDNGLCCIISISLFTYHHETSHIDFPWVADLPYYFGVKRSRTHRLPKNVLCRIIALLLHLSLWNYRPWLSMSQGCVLLFLGSNGHGHNAVISENGLYRVIAIPFHLSSWNFTHRLPISWGCALLILGSKGQR